MVAGFLSHRILLIVSTDRLIRTIMIICGVSIFSEAERIISTINWGLYDKLGFVAVIYFVHVEGDAYIAPKN